ncbi:MAG: alpha/beta hydrolase [Hyphomicrobiaceae bacterium]
MSLARRSSRPIQSAKWASGPAPESDEIRGRHAFDLFCTPSLSSRRTPDHEKLVERARFHLRNASHHRFETSVGGIQGYIFDPERPAKATVLLLHGWSGEAAFMGAFADYLRRRHYRAVLIDMPAHGRSEGDTASLFDCSRAALEVAEATGPVRFALGHSVGAMAVLATGEGHGPLPRAYPFEAYVLIAMPDAFIDVTRMFGAENALSDGAQSVFERKLEALAQRRLTDFTGTKLLTNVGRPALLMHSRDDTDVAFTHATSMAMAVGPNVQLQPFDGLGHRAILYAPPAVRAATQYLDRHVGL